MSKLMNAFAIQIRNYGKPVHMSFWKKDVAKYGHVKYYPRYPDHQDPPIAPTKLLMVQRVKPYKGQPYWDKAILDSLGLQERSKTFAIVKNTPQECARLWRIKHLVKITPIKLPEKISDDIVETRGTYLCENGNFLVFQKVDDARVEASNKFINDEKKMDKITIKRQLRLKWLNPFE